MPQATRPIFPQWHEGQKWRVEYLRNVPATEMKSGGQLPPPQRAVWLYEVTHLDSRQASPILISVTEEGGDGKFEIAFDPKELTLLSVSEVSGGRKMDIVTNPAQDAFLSIPTGYPVIFDWPRLPHARSNASRNLSIDGHRVKEEVFFDADTRLKISLIWREDRGQGLVQTIHSTQSWQVGRPWWDSASAASDMIDRQEKSSYWSISGKLLL